MSYHVQNTQLNNCIETDKGEFACEFTMMRNKAAAEYEVRLIVAGCKATAP